MRTLSLRTAHQTVSGLPPRPLSHTARGVLLLWLAAWAAPAMASDDAQPLQRFRPRWQTGQQWTVETTSQQQQVPVQQQRTVTARWQFAVEAVEPVQGRPCWRIAVRPLVNERVLAQPKTTVWVDQAAMAIRQIETQLATPRGYKPVTESYRSGAQAAPVVGPLSVLPIALPQFPEQGIKAIGTFEYETVSGPGGIKAVGEVGFTTEVRQEMGQTTAERLKAMSDDPQIKSLPVDSVVEVKLATPEQTVRQLWREGSPWPVLADNGVTQMRLVHVGDQLVVPPSGGPDRLKPALQTPDGIKSLVTSDGLEKAAAEITPWSGYWWPMREGRLLVPLGKYDQLTGHQAAAWEQQANPPGPDVPRWFGYCHGWAAASMLEREPDRTHVAPSLRDGNPRIPLDIGDQKGLLTACHTEDLANTWGDRFGDGAGSEDPQDLSPDVLWRLLKLHLGQQGVPLVLDVEPGDQVWNYPVYCYEIQYRPVADGGVGRPAPNRGGRPAPNSEPAPGVGLYRADLTLLMADDGVPPAYLGTKVRKQTCQFTFRMRDGNIVMGSGRWSGPSVKDHPDFAWYPYQAVAENPEVKYPKVQKLVAAQPATPPATPAPPTPAPPAPTPPTPAPPATPTLPATPPAPAVQPPTSPPATPTPPAPSPAPALQPPVPSASQPPANAPASPAPPAPKPTPPKPTPPKPAPKPTPAQPAATPAAPVVFSPLELAALIANRTSSFQFDATLDRFDGASYKPGETFFVRVTSEKPGYLYLLQVDSSGTPALLYPTAGEDNRIPSGRLVEIRPANAAGGFPVAGPAGTLRVKAVVTTRPVAFSGSLELLQTAAPGQQTQGQAAAFRWHPAQQQQVKELLADQRPLTADQIGAREPQELLGPFAQDMTIVYVDAK